MRAHRLLKTILSVEISGRKRPVWSYRKIFWLIGKESLLKDEEKAFASGAHHRRSLNVRPDRLQQKRETSGKSDSFGLSARFKQQQSAIVLSTAVDADLHAHRFDGLWVRAFSENFSLFSKVSFAFRWPLKASMYFWCFSKLSSA